MGNVARVQDPEALKEFRVALLKFGEKVTSALGEAEAEVQRVTMWLENEQTSFWTAETRKRHEMVTRCKEALRFKQVFKSSSGGKQSTIDEEKALARAMRALAEAEQKSLNVKKWIRQLHREAHLYKGSVQRLETTVATDIPQASAKILRMVAALEKYLALKAPDLGPAMQGTESSAGMSSGEPGERAGYAKFRLLTPAAVAKDQAPPGDPAAPWTAGELAPGDADRLANLPAERQACDILCTITIAEGVQSAKRIYLERSPLAFPGDSGWFIGPAEQAPIAACQSLSIEETLKHRPEYEKLFDLPAGTLIVIDSAGVAAVLNATDEDVWNAGITAEKGAVEDETS